MVRTKESQSRLASEPVQPPNPKGFKQLQEPKLISTWTDAIAWQQDYCVQDCHVTPDDLRSGAPRPPPAQGSGGSWCPRRGAPSPTTSKSLTTVRPLSSQEALPNSRVDSCLQRVGPGAICCPHPHPCLPAGLPDVSISRVGSSGEVCLRGVGKGLHKAQVPILQAQAWAPVDSRVSDPAR